MKIEINKQDAIHMLMGVQGSILKHEIMNKLLRRKVIDWVGRDGDWVFIQPFKQSTIETILTIYKDIINGMVKSQLRNSR